MTTYDQKVKNGTVEMLQECLKAVEEFFNVVKTTQVREPEECQISSLEFISAKVLIPGPKL